MVPLAALLFLLAAGTGFGFSASAIFCLFGDGTAVELKANRDTDEMDRHRHTDNHSNIPYQTSTIRPPPHSSQKLTLKILTSVSLGAGQRTLLLDAVSMKTKQPVGSDIVRRFN